MSDRTKEIDVLRQILDQQERDATRRRWGRSYTVTTLDGIPWTVTGKLADRVRRLTGGFA